MPDVTGYFRTAADNRERWTDGEVRKCLETLAGVIPDGRFDWEPEIREGWGTAFVGNEVAAVLNANVPLLLAKARYSAVIAPVAEQFLLTRVTFDEYEDCAFTIDWDAMERISGCEFSAARDEPVSASDLWYHLMTW